jgi:hypothetical protein
MTIAFDSFSGTPSYIECNGGGLVMMARVNTTLTAAAASLLTNLVASMGAPGGKVIGASFCKSSAAMVVNGGADGIAPYVDYANQNLEWRNTKDGTVNAVPTAMAAGGLVLDLVVLV